MTDIKGEKTMTLNEYQERAMSTRMDTCDNDAYMFYGLVGEVGEFASKIAKAIRRGVIGFSDDNDLHGHRITETENDDLAEGLKGEIGDCLWFIAGVADNLGMTLEDVARYNLEKLASRKERGKIEGEGDKR